MKQKFANLGIRLSKAQAKEVVGGIITDDWESYGGCSSSCGSSDPGCSMVITTCQGDCVAYAGGSVYCTSSGSHGEKMCNY